MPIVTTTISTTSCTALFYDEKAKTVRKESFVSHDTTESAWKTEARKLSREGERLLRVNHLETDTAIYSMTLSEFLAIATEAEKRPAGRWVSRTIAQPFVDCIYFREDSDGECDILQFRAPSGLSGKALNTECYKHLPDGAILCEAKQHKGSEGKLYLVSEADFIAHARLKHNPKK